MNRGGRGAGRGRASVAGSSGAGTPRATQSATPTPGRTPSATPGPSRGTTASRASRGAPAVTARFRPKNIRRNEAERDTIARQEEKKVSDKLAEERRARGRGRFRSNRSRGDAMGARGGRERGVAVAAAAGPFSSGFAAPSGGIRDGFHGGGGGGSGSGGGGSSRAKSEGRIQNFGVASDQNRVPRINADKLHVMEPEEELDSDDEAMMAALGARASVLPMGIYRKAHKEAEVVVATTAELEAAENAGEEESLWVDGNSSDGTLPPPEQPAEEGVWDTGVEKPVVIKKDPDSETTLSETPMDVDPKLDGSQEAKESRLKVEVKVKKAPPQDPEERTIQSDLNLLASELGTVTITDENGDTKTAGPSDKDGRMYLFQFPPLLPPLKAGPAPQPESKVKAEPEEFSMADAPPATGDSAQVDLTEEDTDTQEDPENRQGFMSSLLSDGGMMGKLNVRKSGRVELNWGGRILEMSPATGMNFLSTAVIVEQNDEKPAPGVIGGDGIGMGKIMGRFVLAPVWGVEEEWEVTSEELNLGQADER